MKDGQEQATFDSATGKVTAPKCCHEPMEDVGGCSQGCCDDFQCKVCGNKIRVEWPD